MKVSDHALSQGEPPSNWKELFDKKKKDFVREGINFALLNNKKEVTTFTSQPCHGALGSRKGLAVATSLRATNRDEEAFTAFIDWYTKESYVSPFILNKDTIHDDQYLAVNGLMNFPFMNTINIVGRSIYEKPYEYKHWYELVKGGVPPVVAFVVTFSTTYGYQKTVGRRSALILDNKNYFQGSHVPLGTMSLSALKNFFVGEAPGLTDDKNLFFDKSHNYYGGVRMWEHPANRPPLYGWMEEIYAGDFEKSVKTSRGDDGPVVAFKNPFARTNTRAEQPYLYNVKEFDDLVIPCLTEIYHGCQPQQLSANELEKNNA